MSAPGIIDDREAATIALGDPRLPERFWAKVEHDVETGCWRWTGALARGYGQIKIESRMQSTHRVTYEALVGPIPAGLHIDHLCRNPPCCNPNHLEPVTARENTRRGTLAEAARAMQAAKTHCVNGHAFDEVNTRWGDQNGYRRRYCRACERISSRKARRARKDQALAALRALNARGPVPISELVERGLLPDNRYGRALAVLEEEGMVGSRFARFPGRATKIKVWFLTDRGRSWPEGEGER